MGKRNFKSDKKGQVIIVTALLVSVLFLSTALYVMEVAKEVPTANAGQSDVFSGYKQSAISTLISALANATNGGNSNILGIDLAELKTVVLSNSYQAMLTMDYSTLNSSGYNNGFLFSWGVNGEGSSSAVVSFIFASSSPSSSSNVEYTLNVTSTVNFSGKFQQIDGTTKQVNLTVNILNEARAALAQNFTISYQNGQDWIKINSPTTTCFGNGTYTLTFMAGTSPPSEPLVVSLLCQDQRGISIGANLTCTST
jgi:hypothetical protein